MPDGSGAWTFRYDHTKVAALGIPESGLKVWSYNGSAWIDVTSGSVDTVNKKITTGTVNPVGLFAVGRTPTGTVITVR